MKLEYNKEHIFYSVYTDKIYMITRDWCEYPGGRLNIKSGEDSDTIYIDLIFLVEDAFLKSLEYIGEV